jgi:hypothetical protein
MHGPKWYNLKPNYFCRVLLALFIITFMISFPIIFYNALHSAFTSHSVTTTIETQKAVDMKYPNLTVCFAKFFDKQRLDGKTFVPHYVYALNPVNNSTCIIVKKSFIVVIRFILIEKTHLKSHIVNGVKIILYFEVV